jgi:hypothetical protein
LAIRKLGFLSLLSLEKRFRPILWCTQGPWLRFERAPSPQHAKRSWEYDGRFCEWWTEINLPVGIEFRPNASDRFELTRNVRFRRQRADNKTDSGMSSVL